MTDKIFLDADIILDLFLGRQPFFKDANDVFTLLENNEVSGHVSPLIFSNLFYIFKKI